MLIRDFQFDYLCFHIAGRVDYALNFVLNVVNLWLEVVQIYIVNLLLQIVACYRQGFVIVLDRGYVHLLQGVFVIQIVDLWLIICLIRFQIINLCLQIYILCVQCIKLLFQISCVHLLRLDLTSVQILYRKHVHIFSIDLPILYVQISRVIGIELDWCGCRLCNRLNGVK